MLNFSKCFSISHLIYASKFLFILGRKSWNWWINTCSPLKLAYKLLLLTFISIQSACLLFWEKQYTSASTTVHAARARIESPHSKCVLCFVECTTTHDVLYTRCWLWSVIGVVDVVVAIVKVVSIRCVFETMHLFFSITAIVDIWIFIVTGASRMSYLV